MPTIVSITNVYADRKNESIATVESPTDVRQLDDWWYDVVFPLTGDGKGGYSVTRALVVSSDVLGLPGKTFEWEG